MNLNHLGTTGNRSAPILETAGLSFAYPDGRQALKELTVTIGEKERVGIIGPNGAGKTTLFLLLCGILKARSGKIRIAGKPLVPGRHNADVGLVFQNADNQLFCPTVWEDVAFGPRNLGLSGGEVDRRTKEVLETVGALGLADRPVHHLSEGEKRLVSIAGVLSMKPRLILYDEPSSGLDIRGRRRLISLLKQSEETMLIASHDLEFILEICERVILMDEGCLIADGPSRNILMDEELMEAHGQEKPHSLVPHLVEQHHAAR